MLLAVCRLSCELLAMKTYNVIGVFRSIYCLLILLEDDLPGQLPIGQESFLTLYTLRSKFEFSFVASIHFLEK